MNLAEYASFDGLGLAELVRSRQVSAAELARLAVDGVEQVNTQLNAIVEVYPERIDYRPGDPGDVALFAGVPSFLKDIGATERGKRQECGSRLLRGRIAGIDADLTVRFRAAGLNLLGRTATPEFGLSSSTESVLTGATHNPWSLGLMAGGSSGGAAAAVAAGVVPLAHGGDGGGSIRGPASACGLVGLKPSRGRVTSGPAVAEGRMGMVQEFVVTRTVRDTAAMLDAVAAPGVGDPFVIVQPERPYREVVGRPPRRLRIALATQPWGPFETDAEVAKATVEAGKRCEAMGHWVELATPSYDYETFLRAQCVMWAFGYDAILDDLGDQMGRAVDEHALEPVSLSLYHYAGTLTPSDWIWAEGVQNQVRRKVGRFMAAYDLVLTPTLTLLPQPIGRYSQNVPGLDFDEFFGRCDEIVSHLGLFNVTGQPAISLPLFQSESGVPIGIQFAARFGDEATLIRLAGALEEAMPWRDRKPPVHVG